MEEQTGIPKPFPVRKVDNDQWEVLIVPEKNWLTCVDENDARAISAAPVLEYESLEKIKSGTSFAAELEKTADVLEKYHIGFGSRFFRGRAEEARK
jgi:hypothetical protein